MTPLELLAPARDLECGKAAIDCGADAVYIGAERFGARAAAGNSVEDIAELCRYAHRFLAKVYVTVNTIIYDDELDDTQRLIKELEKAGVDAILIQDMALVDMLRGSTIDMHASTQTNNRTVEKVRFLASQGFKRTVLARELSVEEIADIHRNVPEMPLEVFVHGALCVSYSGLCYASQYCFNRSANRGTCAQFCRLKFDLIDSENQIIEKGRYLLSLKDMNQSDNIGRLAEAGATSFKIEGRLKDATYVKNVTSAYSIKLNEFIEHNADKYCRASLGKCKYSFKPDLKKTFNRGYTTYFADGRQANIGSPDTPKAIGEYVGKVKEIRGTSFNVAGTAAFANGDGLCFINADRVLEGFRVNRVEGNRLFPLRFPNGLRPGMALYRNNDKVFEDALSRPVSDRRILVNMQLGTYSEGFELTMRVESHLPSLTEHSQWSATHCPSSITSAVSVCIERQKAKKSQRDTIVNQLSKLGNTIFECIKIDIPEGFDYFIPSSVLGDMRRQASDLLTEKIEEYRTNEDKTQQDNTLSTVLMPNERATELNISNKQAREFYEQFGLSNAPSAFEIKRNDGPLMQCRYCLRHAMGYCIKHGGSRPTWQEPLFLVLPDGKRFRLEFDCRNCQMNVYNE